MTIPYRLRFIGIALLMCAMVIAAYLFIGRENQNPQPLKATGVGALGTIEPRSRVVKLSHNAGPDGAQIDKLLVEEGQDVPADTPLAILSSHVNKQAALQESQARLQSLKAQLAMEQINEQFNNREYLRYKKMQNQSAVSLAQREKTEQAWRTSVARLVMLEAQILEATAQHDRAAQEFKDTTIYAPFAGTVLTILARPGERVESGGAVMEFADLSQMDVRTEVYETDIPAIRQGQKAEVFLPQQQQRFVGTVYQVGFIVRGNDLNDTDPLADRDNRVVAVRIAMPEEAIGVLRHQIYRRVHVRFLP
ncbi:MAG: efflux RND transporter periplasmic adaptor subunit [Holosporales bacterium]|jgi:HlyD family secretion protein